MGVALPCRSDETGIAQAGVSHHRASQDSTEGGRSPLTGRLKRAAADDLIHAIRTVARGGTYLDPSLAGKILGGLVGRSAPTGSSPSEMLSDREEEVLRLIARGFTNREIAAQLDVSV